MSMIKLFHVKHLGSKSASKYFRHWKRYTPAFQQAVYRNNERLMIHLYPSILWNIISQEIHWICFQEWYDIKQSAVFFIGANDLYEPAVVLRDDETRGTLY